MSAFEFIAGARPLDFINTVSWGDGGEERLNDYDDFLEWCRAAKLPPGRGRDARIFRKALQLRAALHAIFFARAEGKRGDESVFGAALKQMIIRNGEWVLRDPNHADAPLWWLTWEAAQLWTSDEIVNVRRCSNDRCLWLFVDHSRRHNRRWCDMQVCGSRAKARAYYARQRAAPHPLSASKPLR